MKKLVILLALFCSGAFAQMNNPGGGGGGGCATCVLRAGDTMTGNLNFAGGTLNPTPTSSYIWNDGISTGIDLFASSFTPNARRVLLISNSGSFEIGFANDDATASVAAITLFGTSAGVTSITFGGPLIPVSTSGIVGTKVADNANAGSIGEVISAPGSAVTLTTTTPINCATDTLTAGDWIVFGSISFVGNVATVTTSVQGGLSTTTDTLPAAPGYALQNGFSITGTVLPAFALPELRVNVGTTTPVYLVAQATFGTSTETATCNIEAHRAR